MLGRGERGRDCKNGAVVLLALMVVNGDGKRWEEGAVLRTSRITSIESGNE